MTVITAQEARELAGPTVQERVGAVFEKIREAATAKKRAIFLYEEFWTNGGYNNSTEWSEARALLEAQGFKVKFVYVELQFVNMYVQVEW